jgi:hypothetical protein
VLALLAVAPSHAAAQEATGRWHVTPMLGVANYRTWDDPTSALGAAIGFRLFAKALAERPDPFHHR